MHYILPHPGQGILGPAPAIYSSQPTILPSTFSIMSSQDPTWHMDTGASSHLNFNVSNLSTIFDKRLFPSVHVGDGKSIPVTNTGHSIIPSHHRPLHLHNVLHMFYADGTSLSAKRLLFSSNGLSGLFLSQKKYALQLLERAHMVTCNPSRTPIDTESKLGPKVQQICLYMHDPKEPHFAALKRILRYVRGTVDFGLQLYVFATTSLVGYTDADWAGCPSTRRSTSGYCVFLGDNIFSWYAKQQHTISRSSAEAKYRGVANVVAETAWIRNLLRELHSPLSTATLVYCDNVSDVYMSANPVQHQWTKHNEIDIHFVRDMVIVGHVRVLHVPSRFQYVDIFIKGLPTALFLSVCPPPAQTAGAY
ncbi:ribonuclease H-like domain-containing protein [Tanacetum coccineum]